MNKLSLLTTTILSVAIFSGCQLSTVSTYSSADYTFEYPATYIVAEPTDSSDVLVVNGKGGRVEIFQRERIHGYSSSGLEEFEADLVPKEKSEVDGYTVWIFYQQDDEETKESLQEIVDSIEIL